MKVRPRSERAGRWSAREVGTLFRRLARENPAPTTELHYASPFELLVAVLLSAQTTDQAVNRATATLFPVAQDPEALLALGPEALAGHLRGLGLFRTKTRHLMATSRLLLERFGGAVPQSRAALMQLPGIGRKSANVILNTLTAAGTIAVDTHVFRVANRTGLAPGTTPRAVETRLDECVPDRYRSRAHHWLVLHGRYVCQARKPRCPECRIRDLCRFQDKTPPDPREASRRGSGATGRQPARAWSRHRPR